MLLKLQNKAYSIQSDSWSYYYYYYYIRYQKTKRNRYNPKIIAPLTVIAKKNRSSWRSINLYNTAFSL